MRKRDWGKGRRGRGIKREGRARMPEALRTEETGSVFSDQEEVTS